MQQKSSLHTHQAEYFFFRGAKKAAQVRSQVQFAKLLLATFNISKCGYATVIIKYMCLVCDNACGVYTDAYSVCVCVGTA